VFSECSNAGDAEEVDDGSGYVALWRRRRWNSRRPSLVFLSGTVRMLKVLAGMVKTSFKVALIK